MHVTELAINKTLEIHLARAGSEHILEMAESSLLLNHLGTVHASAQFALAEASSGEFLLHQLSEMDPPVFAVLRTAHVKFRKPARGTLRASARFTEQKPNSPATELLSRGRALASVLVEVVDGDGIVTMAGQYDWFLQRQIDAG